MHIQDFNIFGELYTVTTSLPVTVNDSTDIMHTLRCGYLSGRTKGRNDWVAARPIRK